MKTITASNANRKFSELLREVRRGEQIIVVSRGKPVATLGPAPAQTHRQEDARRRLLERLRRQETSGTRDWSRDELYD